MGTQKTTKKTMDTEVHQAENLAMTSDESVESLTFKGNTFVLTGFAKTKEAILKNHIVNQSGGKIRKAVSKSTYCLVFNHAVKQATAEYLSAQELNRKGCKIIIVSDTVLDQIWSKEYEFPIVSHPTQEQDLTLVNSIEKDKIMNSTTNRPSSFEKQKSIIEPFYSRSGFIGRQESKGTFIYEFREQIDVGTNLGPRGIARLEQAAEGDDLRLVYLNECWDETGPNHVFPKIYVTDTEYRQYGFLPRYAAKELLELFASGLACINRPPRVVAKHGNHWTFAYIYITFTIEVLDVYSDKNQQMAEINTPLEWTPFVLPERAPAGTFSVDEKHGTQYPVCFLRGLFSDLAEVRKACDLSVHIQETEQAGIYEMSLPCYNREKKLVAVDEIIRDYPNLKALAFYYDSGKIYVLYSASGYPFITDYQLAGLDPANDSDNPWWVNPLARIISFEGAVSTDGSTLNNYRCPFMTKWRNLDYVRKNNGVMEVIRDGGLSEDKTDPPVSPHFACFEGAPAVINRLVSDLTSNGFSLDYLRADVPHTYDSNCTATVVFDNCPAISESQFKSYIDKYCVFRALVWTKEDDTEQTMYLYYDYNHQIKVKKLWVFNVDGGGICETRTSPGLWIVS